ncbi:MAG: hypothetical protein AAF725_08110 [Acidobacteriota bacterium]
MGESGRFDEVREEQVRELEIDPAEVMLRLPAIAEAWNGQWQQESARSGRLGLPVTAGLRRGWIAGQLEAEERPDDRSLVTFRIDAGEYLVDRASVTILVIAAFGALSTLVAPFFPRLLPLVPIGIFLALSAWLLIVARLRNSGPEEFFDQLEDGS